MAQPLLRKTEKWRGESYKNCRTNGKASKNPQRDNMVNVCVYICSVYMMNIIVMYNIVKYCIIYIYLLLPPACSANVGKYLKNDQK